MRINEITDVCR